MTDLTAQRMIERILQSLEETGKRFQRDKKPADAAVVESRTGGSLCRSKVAYPLREVLFLVVCGTIANGDDYDDIVDWGKAHLSFLRGFAEFHFGTPCADW